jgi:glutamate-ammonia-ligase adenylyltransferase
MALKRLMLTCALRYALCPMPNNFDMKSINDLPDILVQELARKWEAFEQSCVKHKIDLPQNPKILCALQRVFAFSDFVARNCIRDPSLLSDLIHSGDLQRKYSNHDYDLGLKRALIDVQDEQVLIYALRVYRHREMTRIAFRDLAGWADLSESMQNLSAFADACLEHTTSLLYNWLCEEYGTPTAEDESEQSLVILALGKLGAQELNFSSDVDLIFSYPKIGETRGASHSLSNEDFFTRLCRQLLKVISQPTSDGLVFRVDLRLRPFGENGPLTMSFDAMENYYQEQGREWERYAWIRARVVSGDKKAANRLMEGLNPFIYRRYLDYGAFDSLRDMKQMISLEVKRKGMKNNIKLGRGGIREIEFFGHMFQLIRGGVAPTLQERSIRNVLRILARDNHIPQDVCDELDAAYVFLRNIEHRLQEFLDQQTHDLPSDTAGQARLAASMGFPDAASYSACLEHHRNNVHRHFLMLLEPSRDEARDQAIEKQLQGIWQDVIIGQHAKAVLTQIGFNQSEEVLRLLNYLRGNLEIKTLSQVGRQRLDQLMPQVLKEVGNCEHPEIALARIIELT